MDDEQQVTISKAHYERLLETDTFMDALEAAGVDNWSGYELAQAFIDEWEQEG